MPRDLTQLAVNSVIASSARFLIREDIFLEIHVTHRVIINIRTGDQYRMHHVSPNDVINSKPVLTAVRKSINNRTRQDVTILD